MSSVYTLQSWVGGVRGVHSFSIFNCSLSSGSSLHLPPAREMAAFEEGSKADGMMRESTVSG